MSYDLLITKRGIAITRGLGCLQISDQRGNVIELDYDEVSRIGAVIALSRMKDSNEFTDPVTRVTEFG